MKQKAPYILIAVIAVALVAGALLLNHGSFSGTPPLSNESSGKDEKSSSGEILPIYFYSYTLESTVPECPAANGIDWDLAIITLSYYMQHGAGASSGVDMGPAEIQRNFAQNCDRDMAIYNDMITKNPHLLERPNKIEYP